MARLFVIGSLGMIETSQTPSTAKFRRLPAHGTTRLGLAPRHPAVSLFGETNSLFGQKNSLLSEEQGIGCKLLNPLGDRLPKPPSEAGIVRNFQKFPVNFPALREFAASGGGRSRTHAFFARCRVAGWSR